MFDIGDCAPPQPTMIRSGKQDLVCILEIFELLENLGKHRCQCGCGQVVDLQARHYRHGVPRFIHGHHNRRGHWLVLQLREAGYLTVSDVAKALGIGTTSLRRREGTLYPRAARIGGIRVYHEADIERLRCRDKVPSTAAGGK